jgi:hypothetical protein
VVSIGAKYEQMFTFTSLHQKRNTDLFYVQLNCGGDFRFPDAAAFVARFKFEGNSLSPRVSHFKFLLGLVFNFNLWEWGGRDAMGGDVSIKRMQHSASWTMHVHHCNNAIHGQ